MSSGSEEAPDLSAFPDEVIFREAQRRMSRRQRPDARVLRPCPYCEKPMGKREFDAHRGQCPENPRVKKILAAMKEKP